MATFHFDLVSPEKLAFSGEVDQVDVPGVEGDFGVLAGHAPVVAAVRPGILTITTGGAHHKVIVLGGLAEVSEKGLTVLADVATSMQDIDRTPIRRYDFRNGREACREGRLRARPRHRAARSLQEHPAGTQHHGNALSPGASRRGSTEVLTKASARHPVAGAELCFDRFMAFRIGMASASISRPFWRASPTGSARATVFPMPAGRIRCFQASN